MEHLDWAWQVLGSFLTSVSASIALCLPHSERYVHLWKVHIKSLKHIRVEMGKAANPDIIKGKRERMRERES